MATKRKSTDPVRIKFGKDGKGVDPVSWLQADANLVLRLIEVCNDCGCAPSFSITRDGGAYRCYFLHDQIDPDDRSQYCPANVDLDLWLRQLVEFWEGVRDGTLGV